MMKIIYLLSTISLVLFIFVNVSSGLRCNLCGTWTNSTLGGVSSETVIINTTAANAGTFKLNSFLQLFGFGNCTANFTGPYSLVDLNVNFRLSVINFTSCFQYGTLCTICGTQPTYNGTFSSDCNTFTTYIGATPSTTYTFVYPINCPFNTKNMDSRSVLSGFIAILSLLMLFL